MTCQTPVQTSNHDQLDVIPDASRQLLQAVVELVDQKKQPAEIIEWLLQIYGEDPPAERSCRECGCTDDRACDPPCHWAELDLCSTCAAASDVDPVNHPPHYTAHPSGVECIEITEHMGFNVGNAVKYLWRADEKGNALEDLAKADWYVERELQRRAVQ